MISELDLVKGLYNILIRDLNNYTNNSVEGLDDHNIFVDFPSIDNAPKPTTVWLQPNWADYEDLTLTSDLSSFHISIFLICQKGKPTVLQDKIFALYNAIYQLLMTNNQLDGLVDLCAVENMNYYPSLTADSNVKGLEMSIMLSYEKSWCDDNATN